MRVTDVGFHNTTPRDWPRYLQRVREHPGGLHVVFSFQPAVELLEAGGPETQVAVRLYSGRGWDGDDNLHLYPLWPEQWLDEVERQAMAQLGVEGWQTYKDRLIVVAGNEPHESTYGQWADWTLWAMDLARERGIHLGVGSFGQGHPVGEPDPAGGPMPILRQIRALFEPVLSDLQDGYHRLLLHEYADVAIGDPRTWWPPWYHVGRFRFWLDVCDELGIGYPSIFISEFGFDSMNNGHVKGYKAVVRNTAYTVEDVMAIVRWFIASIYAPYLRTGVIGGLAWFGYGSDRLWRDFEPEQDAYVLDVLSNTTVLWVEEVDTGGEPVSDIEWVTGKLAPIGAYGVNVRTQPSVSAAVVGGLAEGTETPGSWDANDNNLLRIVETVGGVKHDHYWRQVWLGLGEEATNGWVAAELVSLMPDPEVEEPQPEEEPEPEEPQPELPSVTVELTPEHLAAIARTLIDAGLARLVAAEVLSHLGTMLLEIADAEGKHTSFVA